MGFINLFPITRRRIGPTIMQNMLGMGRIIAISEEMCRRVSTFCAIFPPMKHGGSFNC